VLGIIRQDQNTRIITVKESQSQEKINWESDTSNRSVGSKPAVMVAKSLIDFFYPKSKVSPDLRFFHLHPLPILEQTIIPELIHIPPALTWKPKDAGKNGRMLSVQERIAGYSLPHFVHGCVARLQG
jgi:hypothetical protein